MNRGMCYFLIAALQIMSWVSATSRPFPPHDGAYPQDQIPQSLQDAFVSKQELESVEGGVAYGNEQVYRALGRLGSRPPSCEHKCGGCVPCYAIQIPTTDHLGVQYANYEPEGWKCKCGTHFFDP
ncbi:hypothetical protein L1049_023093 [Liquidambar formosana]|uniref:Epidermal patterning factor-like protein n=1 Tax=Liquidambar formosana TaxID=63359 RepID=A0AAP0RF12_LIQFO